jgi:hypothetical protein
MTTQRTIKKIEQELGVKFSHNGRRYRTKANGHDISFIDQNGLVICLHAKRSNEQSDPYTDYFPGCFFYTVKSLLESVQN